MNPKNVPLYDLSGEWRDMGRRLGELVAGDIRSFNDRYLSDPFTLMRFGSRTRLDGYLGKVGQFVAEYSTPGHDFLTGIADGARLPFDQVLMQAILAELTHVNSERDWPGAAVGCTAACINADTSATRHAIMGQAWDFNYQLPPWFVARLAGPIDTPQMLIFGMGSFFCCGGVNQLGLAVTFTSSGHLPNVPPVVGVPLVVLFLETLCGDSYYAAMDTLVAPVKAGAFNALLTDGYAKSVLVEAAGRRAELIEDEPILVCGNHFQHPNIVQSTAQDLNPTDKAAREFAQSSVFRTERLRTILQDMPKDSLGVEAVKTALADHENRPLSICAHEEDTILHFRTWGATILEPAMRTIHLCPGHPCREAYQTFVL